MPDYISNNNELNFAYLLHLQFCNNEFEKFNLNYLINRLLYMHTHAYE